MAGGFKTAIGHFTPSERTQIEEQTVQLYEAFKRHANRLAEKAQSATPVQKPEDYTDFGL